MEKAILRLELKAAGEDGVVSGVANVMDLIDLGNDRIKAGAFTKTLQEHGGKFPLEADHGDGLLSEVGIGYFTADGNKLELSRGVLTMEARDVKENFYPRLKARQDAGLPAGLSIVYSIPRGKSTYTADGVREISEVRLHKVGFVDMPMNQESLVSLVKRADGTTEELPTAEQNALRAKGAAAWDEALGMKAADFMQTFEGEIAEQQMREQRWKMDSAISAACSHILEDEEMEPGQKLVALDTSLEQYHAMMLEWAARYLELMTDKAITFDTETKIGRVLSTRNLTTIAQAKEALTSAIDALQTLLDAVEPSDDTQQDDDEPGKSLIEAVRELRKRN